MKKLLLLTILFFSCENSNLIDKECKTDIEKCYDYIEELKEMGYSNEWATHKALVEHGFLSVDEEYISIQED